MRVEHLLLAALLCSSLLWGAGCSSAADGPADAVNADDAGATDDTGPGDAGQTDAVDPEDGAAGDDTLLGDATGTPCTTNDDCTADALALGACELALCDSTLQVCVVGHAKPYTPCDDGDSCTLEDFCQAGACTGSGTRACDDLNPCTDNGCEPALGCVFVANTSPCSDGNTCTDDDVCGDGLCQGTVSAACVCLDHADCADLDDDDLCNGTLGCFDGVCGVDAATVTTCDTSLDTACRRTTCNPTTGQCEQTDFDGVQCTDGNTCTEGDTCVAGLCTAGAASQCPCEGDGDCGLFDDDDACNGSLECAAGACSVDAATVADCDPGLAGACEQVTCIATWGACVVVPVADGQLCDDDDACTAGDVCVEGACAGGPPQACDDGDSCTTDACADGGCVFETMACDDGDACTTDGCVDGTCEFAPVACDDGDACTTDACLDGDCTTAATDCDDDDDCTADSCDAVLGCAHEPGACLIEAILVIDGITGDVLVTFDDAATWTKLSEGFDDGPHFPRMTTTGDGSVYLSISSDSVPVRRSDDGGQTWQSVGDWPKGPQAVICGDPVGTQVYGTSSDGNVHGSADLAETFQPLGSWPTAGANIDCVVSPLGPLVVIDAPFTGGAAYSSDDDGLSFDPLPAYSSSGGNLASLTATDAGVLFASDGDNLVHRWAPGDDVWTHVGTIDVDPLTIQSIVSTPAGVLIAATPNAGDLPGRSVVSLDGGETWTAAGNWKAAEASSGWVDLTRTKLPPELALP